MLVAIGYNFGTKIKLLYSERLSIKKLLQTVGENPDIMFVKLLDSTKKEALLISSKYKKNRISSMKILQMKGILFANVTGDIKLIEKLRKEDEYLRNSLDRKELVGIIRKIVYTVHHDSKIGSEVEIIFVELPKANKIAIVAICNNKTLVKIAEDFIVSNLDKFRSFLGNLAFESESYSRFREQFNL